MPTFLKFLTVAFLMFEAAGCGCTEIGCEDGFNVTFNKTSKVWEPGSYVVSINADGQKNNCTFSLPLTTDPVCTSNLQMGLNILSASDPANENGALTSLVVRGTPTLVEVTVARDGVELGKNFFLPSYVEIEPNGAMCGPTCHVDGSSLAVR
jgi:hypothetical protein